MPPWGRKEGPRRGEKVRRVELRERYEEDLFLVKGTFARAAAIALAAALVAVPAYAPKYVVYIASLVAVNIIIAVGLNLLVGYTGQISLGHAGFVAIGAYAFGIVAARLPWGADLAHWGLPWLAGFVAAGIVAGAFGFLVGLPALRLTGPYLTIATLGFGIAVHQVLVNWEWLSGGRAGLFVPKLALAGWELKERELYWIGLAAAAALTVIAYHLVRSYVGRAFVAIRDSDIAAEVMGVNLTTYKTLAFAVSAAYAGIGGALFAMVGRYLEPSQFTLLDSIYYFSMIVVGGLGTIAGGVLGAGLLTVLPLEFSGFKQWQPVVYGAAIILVMALEPRGVYGRWLKIKRWFKTWPF
ncbi:MAG TPA: branched-chain amino acid ABC transporter permease [bacterium]|jgi:branched-chain amino acid transport system permease protein